MLIPERKLPERVLDRVLLEPINGHDDTDGIHGMVYSNDPIDDKVIFEGFYKTIDAAITSIESAYWEGCFS